MPEVWIKIFYIWTMGLGFFVYTVVGVWCGYYAINANFDKIPESNAFIKFKFYYGMGFIILKVMLVIIWLMVSIISKS